MQFSTEFVQNMKDHAPSIVMIDNQTTDKMSQPLKVTAKTRHIARRWHFVETGQQKEFFILHWLKGELQLADDMTKLQTSSISLKHFMNTHVKIPDKIKGHKSTAVGNR